MTTEGGPVEERLEALDGTPLHVLSWPVARPRAKTMIVHGLGEHAARYGHVATALNAVGVSVIAYDQRGHGRTPGPRGHAVSFGHLLGDLDLLWEEQGRTYRAAPRVLLGHSMGGLVSLAWAQTRTAALDGLVVSAPWLGTYAPVPWWKVLGGRLLALLRPSLAMETGIVAERVTADPEMAAAWKADPWNHSKVSVRLFLEVEDWQRRVRGRAEAVKVPLLALVPGADELADADVTTRFLAKLPRERTTVLPLEGARHEPFNDLGRAQAIGAVRDWILERSG